MTKGMLERDKRRKIRKRNMILVGLGSFTVLFLLYLTVSIYFNNHFYKNTIINGVIASNMTVNQVEEAINLQVQSYILKLEERNDVTDQIYGAGIDLHTVFDGSLTTMLEDQNGFLWPISLYKSHELEISTMLDYDESLLKQHFDKLACFDETNSVAPTDAYISEYGDNGYEIIPEDNGAVVKADILYEAIKKSLIALEPTLSLESIECYEEPKITRDYSELVEAVKELNRIAGSKITYEFGDITEMVDGKRISEWLSVDSDYQVNLDAEGIKEFVDYIGKNYNSFGRVRTFQTSYGDVLEINGGDYGWWLNRGKEVEDLTSLIMNGEQLVREPAYYQTAQQYGSNDIGDTYVEVNLTAQHLFFYKEGTLVLETDFVSGNLSKGNGTPVGTYPVQYKENDATLTGEDYSTPVKYWMPFNKNIGFHDAPWRDEFGKDIYLTNGSHGCINMPPSKAKKMYKNISRGVAVVVYELPGTETYEIEEKNSVEDDSVESNSVEDNMTEN